MDKKTILGIVVVAALFLGFAYFNTKQQEKYQQEKYQQEMAAYQAYQDSVAAATRPVVPVADSTAVAASSAVVPDNYFTSKIRIFSAETETSPKITSLIAAACAASRPSVCTTTLALSPSR